MLLATELGLTRPDLWTFAAVLFLITLGWVLMIATAPAKRPAPAPTVKLVGRLVEITGGPRRGLAGWVRYVFVEEGTGRPCVSIELQGGAFVVAAVEDVTPLFGDK